MMGRQAFVSRRWIVAYVALTIALLAGTTVLARAEWSGGPSAYRIIETVAANTALFVGVMAVISFFTRLNVRTLTIGVGFLIAAVMHAYQVFVTSPVWSDAIPAMPDSLLSGSWLGPHLVVAISFLMAWILAREMEDRTSQGSVLATHLYLAVVTAAGAILLFYLFGPSPTRWLPDTVIQISKVTVGAIIFVVALVLHFVEEPSRRDELHPWLVLAIITGLFSEVAYMVRSSARYDAMFDAANVFMVGSYGFVLIGLLVRMHHRFAETRRSVRATFESKHELEREVVERKRVERQLEERARELERSNQRLEEFVFVASHDLQAPLRKIRAFGERLEMQLEGRLDEKARDFLERMIASGERMQQLLDSLLAYSRVSSQGRRFEPVHLGEVAREAVADLELEVRESGGRVEIDDLPVVEADEAQMRQLFQNLIGNGLKYRKEDEPPVVRIRAERNCDDGSRQARCQVVVEDNGIGFDDKYGDRIFKVFQRLHGKSEYEGTGVGLSVCRRIAERHGGSITASSTPGEGATFAVTLPLDSDEHSMNEREASQ